MTAGLARTPAEVFRRYTIWLDGQPLAVNGCVRTQFRKVRDDVRRPHRPSFDHRSGSHQLTHQRLEPGTLLPSLLG